MKDVIATFQISKQVECHDSMMPRFQITIIKCEGKMVTSYSAQDHNVHNITTDAADLSWLLNVANDILFDENMGKNDEASRNRIQDGYMVSLESYKVLGGQ